MIFALNESLLQDGCYKTAKYYRKHKKLSVEINSKKIRFWMPNRTFFDLVWLQLYTISDGLACVMLCSRQSITCFSRQKNGCDTNEAAEYSNTQISCSNPARLNQLGTKTNLPCAFRVAFRRTIRG